MFGEALSPDLPQIDVIAPIEGRIVASNWGDSYGQFLMVKTPYLLNGEPVYYHIVHFHKLEPSIRQGASIHRGDLIGQLVYGESPVDPGGNPIIDFAIWHQPFPDPLAVSSEDPEHVAVYFVDPGTYIADDMVSVEGLVRIPRCDGNPK